MGKIAKLLQIYRKLCCRCIKVKVDLDAVGEAAIDIAGKEFNLVTEAEPADEDHGAITPVYVYNVRKFIYYQILNSNNGVTFLPHD